MEAEGAYKYHYYGASSSETGSQQKVRVSVQWELPHDWIGWVTGSGGCVFIDYSTESITAAQSDVDVAVYEGGSTAAKATAMGNAVTAANNWQSEREANSPITFTAGQLTGFAAGEKLILEIDLCTQDDDYSRISDITLKWRV